MAGDVDNREQQVTQFVSRGLTISGTVSSDDLGGLLSDLCQGSRDIRPVEADAGGLLLSLECI